MKIAVLADNTQWEELLPLTINNDCIRYLDIKDFLSFADADIYINVMTDASLQNYSTIKKTVLINSVANTLKEINANENIFRINGWNGFLASPNWEIAGTMNETIKRFFNAINKSFTIVPDEPGMIASRIIAMIINEAYFALDEKLSSRNEIDIAMKLGTNYPYGPFEWADRIGINNIYALLQKLSNSDKRYFPAPLLQKQLMT